MKSFVVLCVALVAFEVASAQAIRTIAPGLIGGFNNCGCSSPIIAPGCPSPIIAPISPLMAPSPIVVPVNQPTSVAARLADTLSLLTVSSLLSETLPIGNVVPYGCGCGGYVY